MKTLIEQQIKEMGSAKVQLCMWSNGRRQKKWLLNLLLKSSKKHRYIPEKLRRS